MIILIQDYPNKKISADHEQWWLSQGHTVFHEMYFDIEKAKQADVIICFWAEGQAAEMLRAKKAGLIKAKTVIQFVDIDVYQGPWRGFHNDPTDGNLWQYCDQIVFMAQHIKDYALRGLENADWAKVIRDAVVIPLPIDLHKFTYKDHQPGPNIAFIAHRWSSKGIPLLYQFFEKIRRRNPSKNYQLHIVGTKSNEQWLHEYLEHIADELTIRPHIHIQDRVEDINAWLDDKDILISTSYKDAFSLVVGEAMAKGIRVLLHNWWGAKAIWREEDIWTTMDELVEKFFKQPYISSDYRDYVAERYSLEVVMPLWDKLLS